MSLVPFYIPNSSPLLSYSPCVDCGPQDWQSAYTPRPGGFDQTFHQITGQGNTISFNLTSNGFGIIHATVSPECPLEYSINGSDFRSTCASTDTSGGGVGLSKLDYGRHEVVLRTGDVTIFQLFGIGGNYILPDGHTYVNRTLDSGSEGFVYTPKEDWSFLRDDGSLEGNSTLLEEFKEGENGNGDSVSVTDKTASVDITFTGSTIYVYGISGPQCGQAQVELDDRVVADLNMTSTWKTPGVLLYTASGLDGSLQHRLSIANTIPGKQLVIDYAIVTGMRAAKKSPSNSAPLIAAVVGGIVLIILLGIILYFYLIARMKYKLRPSISGSTRSGSGSGSGSKHSEGLGQSQNPNRPNLKVDSWRKQTPLQSADVCSPIDTYHTESIYGGILGPLASGTGTGTGTKIKKQPSGHWPIARLYTRQRERERRGSFATLRSDGGWGGTNLSAPSFPDYIPYQSPFGPASASGSAKSEVSMRGSQLATGNSSNVPRHGHSPLSTTTSTATPVTPKTGERDQIMDRSSASASRSGKKSPATPPAIVGLDSSAERWLKENTYVGQSESQTQARAPQTQGNSQPVRSASGTSHRSATGSRNSRHSQISNTEYEPGPGSPIPEAFEIISLTGHAQNARRSIARLWHTRDAVPSLYRSESLTVGHQSRDIPLKRSNTLNTSGVMDSVVAPVMTQVQTQAAAVTAHQTVPVSASLTATAGLSTNDSFQSFLRPSPAPSISSSTAYPFSRPQVATATSTSPYTQPTSSPYSSTAKRPPTPYTPSSSNPAEAGAGGTSLRRGASVKSVKSFFSGWAKPTPTPGAGEGSETPARPDSGIFPLAFTHSHSSSGPPGLGIGLGLGTVDVPLATGGIGSSGSPNMFIELDPESPLTASRPPSEWPHYNKQRTWGSKV